MPRKREMVCAGNKPANYYIQKLSVMEIFVIEGNVAKKFVFERSGWIKLLFVRSEEDRASNRNLIYKLIYLGCLIWTHLLPFQTKISNFIPVQTCIIFLPFHLGGKFFNF